MARTPSPVVALHRAISLAGMKNPCFSMLAYGEKAYGNNRFLEDYLLYAKMNHFFVFCCTDEIN